MTRAQREAELPAAGREPDEPGPGQTAEGDRLEPASVAEIFRRPLPGLDDTLFARYATRILMSVLQRNLRQVRGIDHIATDVDPFLLVANHVSKVEAAILVAITHYVRHGHHVHFVADWNSQLFPFVGMVMRRAEVITVWKKPAKPRILNLLKPLYRPDEPPMQKAARFLGEGRSVGIYPEGTINRNRERLLRGHLGAATLSLETGAPVVPLGTRVEEGGPENFFGPRMDMTFGPPMTPPQPARPGAPSRDEVLAWHDRVMGALSRLSGKSYRPRSVNRDSRP